MTELSTQPPPALALIQNALDNKVDPESLEKLLNIKQQWEADEARKAFARAMASFQARCPIIKKAREVQGKKMSYYYAGFDDIMRKIRTLLSETGLSITFSCDASTDQSIHIVATILHRDGHFIESKFNCPIPDMYVNDSQRAGSALSYAKRYALCAALNIVVSDEDDDGDRANTINIAQMEALQTWIKESDADVVKFCQNYHIQSLDELPAHKFEHAKGLLQKKIKLNKRRSQAEKPDDSEQDREAAIQALRRAVQEYEDTSDPENLLTDDEILNAMCRMKLVPKTGSDPASLDDLPTSIATQAVPKAEAIYQEAASGSQELRRLCQH